MNSGVPWNVTGVRADARDTARDAARRSGLSVGEWLNSIIDIATGAGVEVAPGAGGRKSPRAEMGTEAGGTAAINERLDDLTRQLEVLARANVAMGRAGAGAGGRMGGDFGAAIAQFDERLDQLIAEGRNAAREMDRRVNAVGHAYVSFASRSALPSVPQSAPAPAFLPVSAPAPMSAPAPISAPATQPTLKSGLPPAPQPATSARGPVDEAATIEQAIAEISARQSALDADAAGPAGFGAGHLAGLEQQLRHITDQIETLRRPSGAEQAVAGLRADLAEIGRALTAAMPRRAIEALEAEVRALAQRLDNGRQCGADGKILAAIERGLGEVRDTLHQLTPAEHLVGFEQALKLLTEKIDLIAANDHDPAHIPSALQQIEQAIAGLRSMATSVASGDALGELAAEVRTLSAKLDIGFSANANADVLRNLDQRIAAITEAIGQERRPERHAVSPEFEAMIKTLSDKLERVQETDISRGEKVVYGHLEERIAKLVEKLDSSEGRLGHLEAIERGMAELLVHLEEMRGPRTPAEPSMAPLGMFADKPPVDLLERGLADLKETQSIVHRRTQDSLEAVHDTLGAVVDRLAMIESDDRGDPPDWPGPPPGPGKPSSREGAGPGDDSAPPSGSLEGAHDAAPSIVPKPMPHVPQSRAPLDPSLPPDHPLEPGSGPPLTRVVASPADRKAAFEAAIAPERPAAASSISGQTSNFIAAARRAAKAAVGEQPALYARQNGGMTAALSGQPKDWMWHRLKSVLVGISVVVIVLGAVRVVLNFMEDETVPADVSRPLTTPPSNDRAPPPADSAPAHDGAVPAPNSAPGSPPAVAPNRQSGLQPFAVIGGVPIPPSGVLGSSSSPRLGAAGLAANDITGSVRSPPPAAPLAQAAPAAGDPPTEISAGLRAAAEADPAAAYELALRYAEGRGVPANIEEAAHWFERAAKGGIALAQFRLGSLYEKGLGVKKDLMEARRLYLAAADKGNAKAMHNLAVLYAEGIDGKPDYKNAVLWFRKAADHDVSDSQYNLAVLYARGVGVEQNLPESYKWFTLAARHGDNEAAKKRDDVGARLDPQSLMAARLAVQTWVAEPQPEEATSVKAGDWDAPRGKAVNPFKAKVRAKLTAIQ